MSQTQNHYTRKISKSHVATPLTELHWFVYKYKSVYFASVAMTYCLHLRFPAEKEIVSYNLSLLHLPGSKKLVKDANAISVFSGKGGLTALGSIAPGDTNELFIHLLLGAQAS